MEKYYTVPEIARLVYKEYHSIYYHIVKHKVAVIRLGKPPTQKFLIRHDEIAKLLVLVDWLQGYPVPRDHPFLVERQQFAAKYIHCTDLAKQLNYSVGTMPVWSYRSGFPKPAVRPGWYERPAVLEWLQLHRPKDFDRINGILN